MKKVIKIKQSDIRGILKNILKEQYDNPDYAAEEQSMDEIGDPRWEEKQQNPDWSEEDKLWEDLEGLVTIMKENGESDFHIHNMVSKIFGEDQGGDNQPENFNSDNSGTSDVEEQGFMYENKKVIRIKESDLRKLVLKTLNEGKK